MIFTFTAVLYTQALGLRTALQVFNTVSTVSFMSVNGLEGRPVFPHPRSRR